ncbi:hypothetical protein [Microseira sp. BLCC-F43]|jgi:CHAT domain-containing protein|uniref:hypothetical protein n=1 Tax=Microseira sp. BLCC-F43 TaxID=3153602 RepID=UPI0035B70AA8
MSSFVRNIVGSIYYSQRPMLSDSCTTNRVSNQEEAAGKIAAQQRRLKQCGDRDLPLDRPYYWAGFVSQGSC